jgi:hypothetical protein
MSLFNYTSNDSTIIQTKTPTVEFNQRIPANFIDQFIRYMGKGLIRVKDYQGNEIKVYYESN